MPFFFLSVVEGQAVRTLVGVALVTVCLGLTGCSLFGKKQAAQNKDPKPFLGSGGATAAAPAREETSAIPASVTGPLPKSSGVIAGKVLAESTGRPIHAWIQVIDLEEQERGKKDPMLDIESREDGFFYIPGLKARGHYKLIARAEEGDKLISQVAWVEPPRPTVLMQLSVNGVKDAPPIPKRGDKKTSESTESSPDRTSAITIEPPVGVPSKDTPPKADLAAPSPAGGSGARPASSEPPNPTNIADNTFRRIPPTDTRVTIPGPPGWQPPPVPEQPQWEKAQEDRQPHTTPVPPVPPGSVRLPNLPTPVPSCGLYGNRLDNFALYDLNGRVWEYKKRNPRARLTLLDFWYHNCQPCLQAIPHLVELQRDFGPYGLEVIGIACETGKAEEQRRNVQAIRGRYSINYTTLLSGGGPEHCPVMKQFDVQFYPLLVLIDADGTILWRSTREGMDDLEHYKLKKMIQNKLVNSPR